MKKTKIEKAAASSLAKRNLQKFLNNKLAVVGAVVLLLIVLIVTLINVRFGGRAE